MKINHTIKEPMTRTAIPTLMPTMVGSFDGEVDDRLEAGREVAGREDRDDDEADGVIV